MLKKSQMKMMETILVLIVFFFLLVFGLIFYASFSETQTDEEIREQMIRLAEDATERFRHSPEVLCSRGAIEYDESNCFDLLKLKGFNETMEENEGKYNKIYPNTLIEIDIIYPEPEIVDDDGYVLYDNTNEDATSAELSYIPTVFFDPRVDERYFGYVKFEVRY